MMTKKIKGIRDRVVRKQRTKVTKFPNNFRLKTHFRRTLIRGLQSEKMQTCRALSPR